MSVQVSNGCTARESRVILVESEQHGSSIKNLVSQTLEGLVNRVDPACPQPFAAPL